MTEELKNALLKSNIQCINEYDGKFVFFMLKQLVLRVSINYIFRLYSSNIINSNGIFKLYYFTIKQNSETVRDFRPAIDVDGTVCLYDNITNKYYYNTGTGSFNYG